MRSDPFELTNLVSGRLVETQPGFDEGLAIVFDAVPMSLRSWFEPVLESADWTKERSSFARWLDALGKSSPPPRSTRALWFEVPEVDLNPARTSVSAFPTFDAIERDCGLFQEGGRTWPVANDGTTLPQGLHPLGVLEQVLVAAGWRDDSSDSDVDEPEAVVLMLVHALVILLVLEQLPASTLGQSLDLEQPLAVTVGWASGDVDPIGYLTAGGWSPFLPPTRNEIIARAPAHLLDPRDPEFDPDLFVDRGGDINSTDDRGRSPLMHVAMSDTHVVLRVIELGADLDAVCNDGYPAIMEYLAGDPDILREFLSRGVNLDAARDALGDLFLHALGDGRCGAENLRLLLESGVVPDAFNPEGMTAWHLAAESSCYDEERLKSIRDIIDVLTELPLDVNERDQSGLPPLWKPLIALVEELDSIKGWYWGTFRPKPHVTHFARYDRVARLLVEAGADPNLTLESPPHARVPRGATPLMLPRYDTPALQAAMLVAGADPLKTCARGRTARQYARKAARSPRCDRAGAAEVAKLLKIAEQEALSKSS